MPSDPAAGGAAAAVPESVFHQVLDNLGEGVYLADSARRITYWNAAAERLTGYPAAEMLGRLCCDGPLHHISDSGGELCSGRCPLSQAMGAAQACTVDVYLLHRDGHRVPVRVTVTPLRDDTGRVVGAAESFGDNRESLSMRTRLAELERAAFRDPLTGLANRRRASEEIERRVEELRRYGWPFGLIFLDIDRFKQINDNWGHEAGDAVLRMVARDMQSALRDTDLVSRWGGEEFLAVVLSVDQDRLSAIAEKLRYLVEQSGFESDGRTIRVTVSIGATLAAADDTVDGMIRRADQLMYQSKREGRNRVSVRLKPG
jgi:diguanylate cyclase (GGDEF)-like protein/PAS domain S-box-containing protein